jgi:hypothetical protein
MGLVASDNYMLLDRCPLVERTNWETVRAGATNGERGGKKERGSSRLEVKRSVKATAAVIRTGMCCLSGLALKAACEAESIPG